ncbi:MAG: hypothetical protein IT236_02405 [Bacteroidia bacterium]|nr:hypothetical protein [Bacteroidia bacterium]
MNKNLILSALALVFALISCGPAAENRQIMHERAKIFQDSIANVIRTTIAEAEGPAPASPVIVVPPTPTAAATPTTK